MGPVIAYVLAVVAMPALGASAVAALLVRRTPWGRHGRFASSAVGAAVAVTALWSFLAEVDSLALLRQFPITLPEDDAPFERWHRLALAALVLVPACPALAWACSAEPGGRPRNGREAIAGLLACAFTAGFAHEFPGTGWAAALGTGVACALAGWLLQRTGAPGALGAGALWSFALAALSVASGFPSLAAVSASMGLACAALAWSVRGARAALPPPGFAVAALVGVVLACGRAYSDDAVPAWAWWATLAVPVTAGSIAAARRPRRTPA